MMQGRPTTALRRVIARAASLLTLKVYDVSEAGGRSKERYRRVALSTAGSGAAKAGQIVASLLSVPLTLHYLGQESYGLWLTISSVVAMLSFADLGIGNGLLNAVADAYGRDDRDAARRYVSSAFFALCGIALALGLAFWLLYPWVPWARLFNVRSLQASAQVGPAIAVLVIAFIINLPIGVVARIRGAHQETFIESGFNLVSSALTIVALLVAIRFEGGLPVLALALVGTPILVTLIDGAELWGRRFPWLKPSVGRVTRQATERVMRVSMLFLILQVAAAVAYQSDAIIVARVLGPELVPQYAVPMKLFLVIPAVLGFVYAPLWPAYTEALARGEAGWARTTLRRSLALALGVSVPSSILLALLAPWLLRVWVGGTIVAAPSLLIAGCLWAVLASVSGALAAFMNGAHLIKFQAAMAVLMMLANVAVSIVLTARIGVSGAIWGSVIAQSLFMIPFAFYVPRALRRICVE